MKAGAAALLIVLTAALPAGAVEQGLEIRSWADGYPEGSPGIQSWFRETYFLSAQPRPWLFLTLTPIVERDSHGDILRDELYDPTDRGISRAAMRFRDLAVGFRWGRSRIVLGRQRLTWGRTSFLNATDNLVPRDWTDPLDEVRLSPWAADATWEGERWHVEGALVPRYAPSRLPPLSGRWFTPQPTAVPNPAYPGAGPATLTASYAWGTSDFPAVTWDTLQGAVRAGYRGAHGEIQASYFRGYDDAPAILPRAGVPDLGSGTLPVFLDRNFLRLEVPGLDGEWLVGAWSLRAEAGYFHYLGGTADGYLLAQVEAEWSREAWQVVFGYGDAFGPHRDAVAPTALDQALVPAAFVHAARGEATEWQVALDASVGTTHGGSLVRLSGSYPFAGHVRAGGEVDVISGASTTFWGRWRDNDRLRAFIQLNF